MSKTTYILALALLLIPSLSWGGAASKLRGVMSSCSAQTGTVDTLNGSSGFVDGGDTGIGTPSAKPLCSGTATISATCDGTTSGAGAVYLVTVSNGATTTASLSCANGEAQKTATLTAAVSGRYTAQVYSGGSGYTEAGSFSFPVAQ